THKRVLAWNKHKHFLKRESLALFLFASFNIIALYIVHYITLYYTLLVVLTFVLVKIFHLIISTAGHEAPWKQLSACRGSCGLRFPPPVNSPMTYSYGKVVYDSGTTRVVGGMGAAEAEWPWLVSIQHPWVPGLGHWCGGSLITADWVLTAAHCFDKFDNISMVYVLIGATQLTQPGPGVQVRNAKKVVVHRSYRRKDYSYDIALMQLDRPVLCSSYIQLAWMSRTGKQNPHGAAGSLFLSLLTGLDSADRLQQAKVRLIDLQLCNSSDWYAGEVHPYNLCAGYPQGTIDTCKGDSGGPLMCQDNNADYWWVIGLTSFGEGCARPRQPGVYTSVQHFYDWIDYNMRINS
uniref:Acrosin n=1 Tax=Serinus canaria TaxID=9135 RepID=A0A8C9MS82_SERCA